MSCIVLNLEKEDKIPITYVFHVTLHLLAWTATFACFVLNNTKISLIALLIQSIKRTTMKRHGGHSPSWHRSTHLCLPQASFWSSDTHWWAHANSGGGQWNNTLSHVSPQEGTLAVHGRLDICLPHWNEYGSMRMCFHFRLVHLSGNHTGHVRVPENGHAPHEPEWHTCIDKVNNGNSRLSRRLSPYRTCGYRTDDFFHKLGRSSHLEESMDALFESYQTL